MIPDPYKKTVSLPVKVVDGKLKFFYGGDLQDMEDGAIGELIIPEFCITNDYRLSLICKKAFAGKLVPQSKNVDPTANLLKRSA